MSDILTKSLLQGVPGTPGVPSTPGTPASPAYCIDVPTQIPQWKVVTVVDGKFYTWYVVFDGYKTVVVHTCYPAVDGTPPTPGSPGTISTPDDYYIGWNAGAVSILGEAGDFEYQFGISTSAVGVVTGVGGAVPGGDYQNIAYAIYCDSGKYQVLEYGVPRTAAASFATADVFTISRTGTQVKYYKGSSLVYTSLVPSYGTAFADASLYFAGDVVNNAALVALTAPFAATTGTVAGVLRKLTGFSYNDDYSAGGFAQGVLRKLKGASVSYDIVNTVGKLRKLTGQAFSFEGSTFTNAVLPKLSGYGEADLIQPQFAVSNGVIRALSGFSIAQGSLLTSTVGTLRKLTGFSYDGEFTVAGHGFCSGKLRKLYGYADTAGHGGMASLLTGSYSLFAQGHQDTDVSFGFSGTLTQPYGFAALGGAQARLALSGYSLSASGTTTILGEANLVAPSCRLMATGTGTSLGRAYLKPAGHYKLAALGGAQAHLTGPRPRLIASGIQGSVGEIIVAIGHNHYGLTASGTQRAFGVINGTLRKLRTGNSGVLTDTLPRFTLVASGHQVVTPDYEAYAVAFTADKAGGEAFATTRYTDYPFDRIVRFGGSYYGVGTDGLFLLDGPDFNGSPIYANVEFAETDFGNRHAKRPISLYLRGRMGVDLVASISSNEVETDTYTYKAIPAGERNQRVKFGKGIRGVYFSFGFTNINGEDFELDELTPEIEILRRTA